MAECIHFPDDPNANCALCKPKPVVDLWATDDTPSGSVRAKYHGECVSCDGAIYEGDFIVRATNGWKHEDCRG